jgi:hypothetical protein
VHQKLGSPPRPANGFIASLPIKDSTTHAV